MTDPVTHHSADYRLASAPLSHRDGVLRADDFDDLYFSAEDGLGEARHVFLDGNDLAGRIAAAAQFTIAETGFGTGLNFLAVMALLESNAPKQNQPGCQIDYISFESRPWINRVARLTIFHSNHGLCQPLSWRKAIRHFPI